MSIFRIFQSYAFYSGVSAALNVVLVPYLTRSLTPEDLGVIGMFQVAIFLGVPLISLQSMALVGINWVSMSREEYLQFLEKYLSFGFIMFSGVLVCSLIASLFYSIWLMLFVMVPFIALSGFFLKVKNVELVQSEKPHLYGRLGVTVSFLSLLLTVLFISGLHWGWEGRIAAIMIAGMMVLICFITLIDKSWKGLQFSLDISFVKELFGYGFPLLIGVGAGWLINQADRLIVLHYFTLSDVGVYTAAYMVGMIINMVNEALVNTVAPKVYRALDQGKAMQIVKHYHRVYSVSVLALSTVLATVSYLWVDVLLGDAYSETGSIVAIVTFAFGFSGVYRVPGLVIEFYKMNILRVKLLYTCAFFNILLSILLIPYHGLLAPALGTLLAYIILSIMTYWFANKAMTMRGG